LSEDFHRTFSTGISDDPSLCGRFTRKENFQYLAESLRFEGIPNLQPQFNIASFQLITCIRTNPDTNHGEWVQLKWGLVPSWSKDPGIGHKVIDARGETAADKPSFRHAFKQQRCLVLADGFYEWKREGKIKQPFYIRLNDNRPFAFAGLWERWDRQDPP